MARTAVWAQRGKTNHHAGLVAEAIVAREYARRGMEIGQQRWRGSAGEIDLVARDGEAIVFIEVKKSRSFERAADRVSRRQIARIYDTASEYLASEPRGMDTEARFDVALVNEAGEIEILENAFMMM